jgi:hypothetical protein
VPDDDSNEKIGDEQNSVALAAKKPRSWPYKVYRLATSVPLLVLAILLLLEIWLRQGSNPLSTMNIRTVDDRDAMPRLQLSRRVSPQALLIGSSLMLALNQDESGGTYLCGYDPSYLRGLLDRATGKKITCLNLATDGQMASEAYFMAAAACNAPDFPRVLIYGVAWRDFVDAELGQECRTESFNSIAPFAPISAVRDIYSEQAMQEFIFCHYFYLYRNRTDFKNLLSVPVKDLLENLPLDRSFVRLAPDCYWRPAKKGILIEQWTPGRQGALVETMRLQYPNRLKAYFKSVQTTVYDLPQKQTADLSHHYFKCLQELCKEKKVRLVVVNMPISPDTAKVVPAKPMQEFRDFLHKGEQEGGYDLIDLWADRHFSDSDYIDGVHLNVTGMRKFSDMLVQELQARFPAVLDQLAVQSGGKK